MGTLWSFYNRYKNKVRIHAKDSSNPIEAYVCKETNQGLGSVI